MADKKIEIDLEARTASFVSNLHEADTAVEKIGHRTQEARGFLDRFKSGFEFGAGLEAFRKGLELVALPLERIKQGFEETARIGRDALKLGISAEDMSRFQHAANATGTEIGALNTAMDHLSRTVGEVTSGEKGADKAAAAFAKLGINAKELAALSPAETFKRVAEAASHLGSAYDRANVMQEILGRSGRELAPLFEDLNGLMRESDEIGFTRTAEDIRRVEEEERKLAAAADEVKATFMSIATSDWSVEVVGKIKSVAEAFNALYDKGEGGVLLAQRAGEIQRAVNELNRAAAEIKRIDTSANQSTDDRIAATSRLVQALKDQEEAIRTLQRADTEGIKGAPHIDTQTAARDLSNLNWKIGVNEHLLKLLEGQKEAESEAGKAADARMRAWERGYDQLEKLIARSQHLGDREGMAEQQLVKSLKEAGLNKDRIQEAVDAQRKIDEFDKQNERVRKAAELYREAETPLQRYNDRMAELDDLLKHGALNQTQYAQAVDHAKTLLGGNHERHADFVTRRFDFRVIEDRRADPQREALTLAKQNNQTLARWDTWFQQIWQSITNPNDATNQDVAMGIA